MSTNRLARNTPGPYGYRCRNCGGLAFSFVGIEKPIAGDFIENYEISQRGQFASDRKSQLRCQGCAIPVTAVGARINSDCVVVIADLIQGLKGRNEAQSRRATSSKNVRFASTAEVTRESLGAGLLPGEEAVAVPSELESAAAPANPYGAKGVDPDTKQAKDLTDEELRFRAKRLKVEDYDTLTPQDLLAAVEEAELENATA